MFLHPRLIFTCCLLLIVPLITDCDISLAAEQDVPHDWLDSLEANLWRFEEDSTFKSVRMMQVIQKLDDEGNIKETDTTWQILKHAESGEQLKYETDRAGNILSDEPIEEKRKRTHPNPLDPVKLVKRDDYQFKKAETDAKGNPQIRFIPNDQLEDAFDSVVAIDTTQWIITQFEGRPHELPTMVKDMDIKMQFDLVKNGHIRPGKIETLAHAGMLFINIRIKVMIEFFDYEYK